MHIRRQGVRNDSNCSRGIKSLEQKLGEGKGFVLVLPMKRLHVLLIGCLFPALMFERLH